MESVMAIFKKRSMPVPHETGPAIGRKLSSGLSIDECVANFRAVVASLMNVQPEDLNPLTLGWGDLSQPTPARLLGVWLESPRPIPPAPLAIYLAIWEGVYAREMYVVLPDYGSPTPIFGSWKMRDSSLTSTGSVTSFHVTHSG
jgi:hypothetical protein